MPGRAQRRPPSASAPSTSPRWRGAGRRSAQRGARGLLQLRAESSRPRSRPAPARREGRASPLVDDQIDGYALGFDPEPCVLFDREIAERVGEHDRRQEEPLASIASTRARRAARISRVPGSVVRAAWTASGSSWGRSRADLEVAPGRGVVAEGGFDHPRVGQQLRVPGAQRQRLRHRAGPHRRGCSRGVPRRGHRSRRCPCGRRLGLCQPQGTSRVLAGTRQAQRQRAVIHPGRLASGSPMASTVPRSSRSRRSSPGARAARRCPRAVPRTPGRGSRRSPRRGGQGPCPSPPPRRRPWRGPSERAANSSRRRAPPRRTRERPPGRWSPPACHRAGSDTRPVRTPRAVPQRPRSRRTATCRRPRPGHRQ